MIKRKREQDDRLAAIEDKMKHALEEAEWWASENPSRTEIIDALRSQHAMYIIGYHLCRIADTLEYFEDIKVK